MPSNALIDTMHVTPHLFPNAFPQCDPISTMAADFLPLLLLLRSLNATPFVSLLKLVQIVALLLSLEMLHYLE